MAVITLVPIANNISTGYVHLNAFTTAPSLNLQYAQVDDQPTDEDTTYIGAPQSSVGGATAGYEYWTLNNPSLSGVITNVRIVKRMRITTSRTTLNVVDIVGGIGGWMSTRHFTSITSFSDVFRDYAVNPNTTNAWTWAELATTDYIGIQAYNSRPDDNRITQFYLIVTYTPAATGLAINGMTADKINGITPAKFNGVN